MTDIKQVYIIYALLESGERYAIAAYHCLKRAKSHVDRCQRREYGESMKDCKLSPAEILGIEGFQIDVMEVK